MGGDNRKKRRSFVPVRYDNVVNKKIRSKLNRRRSQNLKDMEKLESNDEAFHLSLMKIRDIIQIVRSRKTPTFETYKGWDKYAISFYLKMSERLENTLEDYDENWQEYSMEEISLKEEQEEPMERSGMNQPSEKEISDEELDEKQVKERNCYKRIRDCRRKILTGPFEFGSYSSSGTKADRSIPYHLYLLVKDAVDIMEGNNNTEDLKTVEKKISFFCNYFHTHIPTGWKYDRDNAKSLIASYDTTVKPRDLMAGYTPIPLNEYIETQDYDEESQLVPDEMVDAMSIIHSRKTPALCSFNWPMMSFYYKLCSCFRIEFHNLEAASEDDVCLMNTGRKPHSIYYDDDIV